MASSLVSSPFVGDRLPLVGLWFGWCDALVRPRIGRSPWDRLGLAVPLPHLLLKCMKLFNYVLEHVGKLVVVGAGGLSAVGLTRLSVGCSGIGGLVALRTPSAGGSLGSHGCLV